MKKIIKSLIISSLVIVLISGCGKADSFPETPPTPDFAHDTPVGEITKDAKVSQTFICECSSIASIDLYGATYMRENTGTVNITIYSASSNDSDDISKADLSTLNEVCSSTLNMSEFEDNTLINIPFDDTSNNSNLKNKTCLIVISSPDGEPGSSVTFWTTQDDLYQDGHLSLQGYPQYNDLWFVIHSK